MKRIYPTEFQEQSALMRWARLSQDQYPELSLLFHIPNGSQAHIAYRKKLKQLGLVNGIPDLFLCCARRGYHGLFLEMKRGKGGRTSPAQVAIHTALEAQGYRVCVANGFEEARDYLVSYLGFTVLVIDYKDKD